MKPLVKTLHISYIFMVAMLFIPSLQTIQSNPPRNLPRNTRSFSEFLPKTGEEIVRRNQAAPSFSPKLKTDIVRELEKAVQTVEEKPIVRTVDEPCHDEACLARKKEKILQKNDVVKNMMLKPAYSCDEWNQEKRTCYLNRNLGNTVTFVLSTPPRATDGRIKVEWRQEFANLKNERNKTHYYINPMDPPWNIVIGSRGHEFRVSPISEIDLYNNLFTAVVHFQNGEPTQKLHFIIRKIPIDVGHVYPGATLTLHVPSFITLPAEGMTFKWTLNGALGESLPSNMRPSPSGSSLRISELRKGQEGVVACFIYTNLGIQVSPISFSIRQVESENNNLVFIATRPSQTNRNKKKRSKQLEDDPYYFVDSTDSEQEYLKVKKNFDDNKREPLFNSRTLSKRQHDETPSIQKRNNFHPIKINDDEEDFDEYATSNRPENSLNSAKPKQKKYIRDTDWNKYDRFEKDDAETTEPQTNEPLKLLEQHKQALLAEIGEKDPQLKQVKVHQQKRFHTTTESFGRQPEFEAGTSFPPLQERHKLAKLISKCDRDSECSLKAECLKGVMGKPGFCQCSPQYEGNGIFCWESGKWLI